MSEDSKPVFVYGTLRPGASAFGQVASFVRAVRPATLPQAALYDLGPFPMLAPGEGKVVGEILDLEPAVYRFALQTLDRYEGYNARLDRGLYVRREWEAVLDSGERVSVWVYVGAPHQVLTARLVPHGDWLRWRSEQNLPPAPSLGGKGW